VGPRCAECWSVAFAADLVALLAVIPALALGHPLPGLVVVLMQTGGEALERYARAAPRRLSPELEAAAPRIAHRVTATGAEDIAAEMVAVGELLLVRPGELVPCDGIVMSGALARGHVAA
jgi:cation transport ATPase